MREPLQQGLQHGDPQIQVHTETQVHAETLLAGKEVGLRET